jgi:hypothetical protein
MENATEEMAEAGIPQCTGSKVEGMKKEEEQKALPELSKEEFRRYNRMADSMNYFVGLKHRLQCIAALS